MKKTKISSILCIFIVAITLLTCCTKRIYVPVETYKRDSVLVKSISIDTLIVQDSVYVLDKGDTVYFYKYKTKYKVQYIHDTTFVCRVDSVAVPYEVEKRVRYIPSVVWWVIGVLAFISMIGGLFIYIGFKFRK